MGGRKQENQQQIDLDEVLVPRDDQVKIGACNIRIALEKKQKEPTYQLALDIFKQYSCYMLFSRQLMFLKYICSSFVLQITLRVPNQEFVEPPPHDELVSFVKQLGYTGSLELVSKMYIDHMYQSWRTFLSIINKCLSGKSSVDMGRFQFQIDSRQASSKRREQMPYPRFTKVIINHFLSKHNTLPKRQSSFINTIKYDSVLGKLKFLNKGEEHQKYGMSIPDSMMNDAIRNSATYLTYLALSTNTKVKIRKVGKGRGKGLMGKMKAEPTPDEAVKLAKSISLTEAEEQEKKKLKGVATVLDVVRPLLSLNKSNQASREQYILQQIPNGLGEGPTIVEDKYDNSNWGSDDEEVEVLSSDDERTKTDGSEKDSNEKDDKEKYGDETTKEEKTGDEKAEEEEAKNEKAAKEEVVEEQARNLQTGVIVPEPQQEKPTLLTSNTSNTLSSAEYVLQENPFVQRPSLVDTTVTLLPETTTHSPKQQPPKISKTKVILKKSKKPKEKVDVDVVLQRLIKLEKKVATISKINHVEAIEESVQANITNEVKNQLLKYLPKVVSEFIQPRMESIVRDVLKTTPITLYQPLSTSAETLTEYELKLKLYNMMQNSRSFLNHEKHLTLYNALINSMDVNKANVQGNKDTKKKRHDNQDPLTDADKESKKRKRKDADTSSSKKELIQDDVEDDDALVQDDDMAADDTPHHDAAPTQGNPKWFKQDVVVRQETPDPEWYKEPNADDAREQNWLNEMLDAKKDLVTFDDLIGSTIDFTKFAKHFLKKDKITKADLEGQEFKLLKGNYRNYIELEYNMEQCPPDRITIYVDFFFNKDLEYLKTGNTENKYLKEIMVRRADQKEYVFKEAVFPKLHLNGIEDMYLLYAQNKLHHLKGDKQVDLVIALHLFIRRIILKKRVEDV
ncbi:hypothetical protein Tco_0200308 [Tanacetum coccineum]